MNGIATRDNDALDSLETAKRKLAEDKAAWLSYEDYDRYQAEGGA